MKWADLRYFCIINPLFQLWIIPPELDDMQKTMLKIMRTTFGSSLLSLTLLFALGSLSQTQAQPVGGKKFERDFSKTKQLFVEITTDEGVMKLELFPKNAPNTVANFEHLVKSGFYKGLIFHRIIEGFMAQGGDPKGDGTGGPGWTIPDEIDPKLQHEPGSLSMANAGPNTAGSQFFICHVAQPHLNGRHAIFGKLVSGFDVLTRLERGDPILDAKMIEIQ
jgi:peptidyl-prolyl cis-trans isomerase B (cyclophilin B)